MNTAIAFALVDVVYCGIIIAGILIDDAVDTMLLEKSIAEHNENLYGENTFDFYLKDGAMDSVGRMTLDLIPSLYK